VFCLIIFIEYSGIVLKLDFYHIRT